ncbi:hypothetical protein QKW60_01600 [Defluviimonas aestuarii]|uniref:hypothetical protein n=1 Tax=Albidovulum aestuarii TaxID=1130726 RepID=UPI00249AA1DF|nr:hypothetical protein [Defluviimonas aestuarii]MDI3335088.1 hypothetical protein [Defluviimonas aestuarii]
MSLAERVNARDPGNAPVMWWPSSKRSGGHRIKCELPPELKAVHYLLKPVLEQLYQRSENVFGVKHFGRDAAAGEVKRLQNEGYCFAAVTDVVDCYQSVNPDALYELPLPKEVIRRTLDLREIPTERDRKYRVAAHVLYSLGTTLITHNASGPRGLIQGSPLSGLILAWLLNGIPTRDDARVLLCFDNLIVLAKTADGTRTMADTLAAHFERCSAGPLALCEPEYFDNIPFDFLGYRFDPDCPEIGISERGHARIMAHLVKAETAQERLFNCLCRDHRAKTGGNSLGASINPLLGEAPALVWRALLNVRSGYSMVPASSLELAYYREASRWLAEWSGTNAIIELHDNLFADVGTPDRAQIWGVLKRIEGREAEPR